MIERHWSAIAKKERSEDYIDHLKNETFMHLKQINGFLNAKILTKRDSDGIYFLVITQWSSISAVKQFAGEDFETAVVPDKVKDMMVSYDQTARHYQVSYQIEE